MARIVVEDHPELIERGALPPRQIRDHLARGFPVDADVPAARLAFEHYVRILALVIERSLAGEDGANVVAFSKR